MSSSEKALIITPLLGFPDPIGRNLWQLENARARTLSAVQDLTQAQLDAEPEGSGNTVGTLLYHLAAIEADWLYVEALEEDFPEDIMALFSQDVRSPDERLSPVPGVALKVHLERPSFVQRRLLEQFTDLTEDDYRRVRKLPDYNVTPEWVLHHLAQHEALHRSQMLFLLRSGNPG